MWTPKSEEHVAQQLYISVTSQTGCNCDVIVTFPRERPSKKLKAKLKKEAKERKESIDRMHRPEQEQYNSIKRYIKREIDLAWDDEHYYPPTLELLD